MPKLLNVTKIRSPLNSGFLRISGDVFFFKKNIHKTLWFDYPDAYDHFVDISGDPWLVALLPCAFLDGEDLVLEVPVDPVLLHNTHGILKIWGSWFDDNPANIKIHSPVSQPSNRHQQQDTLIFFSGGVDSYFSLLRSIELTKLSLVSTTIHLATVWGFDIPLFNNEGFEIARTIAISASTRYKANYIEVRTNLREIPAFAFKSKWYAELTHGAALASVGLLFQTRMRNIIIGSTYDFANLSPWGSHPLVDQLFSTSQTSVVHDGADSTRVEKTDYILHDPDVANSLRVCWGSSGNCSKCSKCLRTMVTIDLLGKKDLCHSFDWSQYSMKQVANVYLDKAKDAIYFQDIFEAAVRKGRFDIAAAVDKSIKSSYFKRKYNIPYYVNNMANFISKLPFFWRYTNRLRQLHNKVIGR